jgi:hypothetical protein
MELKMEIKILKEKLNMKWWKTTRKYLSRFSFAIFVLISIKILMIRRMEMEK